MGTRRISHQRRLVKGPQFILRLNFSLWLMEKHLAMAEIVHAYGVYSSLIELSKTFFNKDISIVKNMVDLICHVYCTPEFFPY